MRRCQKCKDLKLLNEFFARNKIRALKSPYCKACFVKINADYKKRNPEGVKVTKKKEYSKNRRRYLDTDYKRKYGISLEDFENKERIQNYLCEICKKPNPSKRRWHVDHCHKTGKIRDLLCHNCNRLLGGSQENIEILLNAINYLKKHLSTPATSTNDTNPSTSLSGLSYVRIR